VASVGCDGGKFDAFAFCEESLRSAKLDVGRCDIFDADIGGRLRRPHSRQSGMSGKPNLDAMPAGTTSGTPQVLLSHHLKQ
jgi:hypothetical protein